MQLIGSHAIGANRQFTLRKSLTFTGLTSLNRDLLPAVQRKKHNCRRGNPMVNGQRSTGTPAASTKRRVLSACQTGQWSNRAGTSRTPPHTRAGTSATTGIPPHTRTKRDHWRTMIIHIHTYIHTKREVVWSGTRRHIHWVGLRGVRPLGGPSESLPVSRVLASVPPPSLPAPAACASVPTLWRRLPPFATSSLPSPPLSASPFRLVSPPSPHVRLPPFGAV